jgi:lipopolysaccharide/colanic/teichoic acid biosynthesis glycosyltransferase
MRVTSYLKYGIRFLFLQILLTYSSIYYLNNFLVSKKICEGCLGRSFLLQINNNLWEDRNRFYTLIPERFVDIEIFLGLFIFLFLILLYSTKFYTYVNELTYSLDRSYLDEFVSIYMLWTSSFIIFLTLFRVSNLISRGYLILYTFIVPLILLVFRNSEFISSLLGRSVTNENFITVNLDEDSVFRKLRIMTFRKNIQDYFNIDINNHQGLIKKIDSKNKEVNLNLIVLNLGEAKKIPKELEEYFINLNKKILILSKNEVKFDRYFLNRIEFVSNYYLTYFNNDIQYGSKYILKRVIDIILSSFAVVLFSPIFIFIYCYVLLLDGTPAVIKQDRVGLHGKSFKMYKFRTMKKNAHELRKELEELNKNDDVIFKIENDPRIITGTHFLRNLSLDELPQFFNVLKGEMSLVGPRPLFDEDTKLFDKNYMRRLNVLPGITGLLQINDRNTDEFSTWYKYDLEYIENWSIYLDIKIILKTPLSLFNSKVRGL